MTTFVLVVAAVAIAGGIAMLIVLSVLRRVVRTVGRRRQQRLHDAGKPLLVAIASGRRFPTGVSRSLARDVERQALHALGTLRGEAAESVIGFLRSRGIVERSRRRLRRPGAVGRARAAERLGTLHAVDASDALVAALRTRSPEVRQVAARALGKVGGADAPIALLRALDGRRSLPAGQVAAAIVTIGPVSTPALREALQHGHPVARFLAVLLLGHLEALDAATDVERALFGDPLVDVRIEAARALGRIGSPSSTAALIGACGASDDERVRAVAAASLGSVGATVAIARLAEILEEPGHAAPHAAARSLALLGIDGRVRLVAAVAAGGPGAGHAAEALALREVHNVAHRAAVGRRSGGR